MHARLFSVVYLCTGINLISYIPSIGLLVYYIQSKLQFVTLDKTPKLVCYCFRNLTCSLILDIYQNTPI